MPIAYYMDEHVPPAISTGLRRRGVDVLTVQEDGRRGEADAVLLDRATQLGRVVFTRDRDFLIEAARRQAAGIQFVGVVYAHQLAATPGRCVNDLQLLSGVYDPVSM